MLSYRTVRFELAESARMYFVEELNERTAPVTSSEYAGDVVPMPNRLLVLSQKKLLSPLTADVPVQNAAWPAKPVPVIPPDEPLEAAVIRPFASTVRLALVYEPGVTAVFARVVVMEVEPEPVTSPDSVIVWFALI